MIDEPEVSQKMTQSLDWETVQDTEAMLRLAKPVTYLPNPSVRSAAHGSMFGQPAISETVTVVKHLVMYNPDLLGVERSIVHELSHAKTDELGYYCFPTLEGGEAAAYEMSWGWIDEAYAHMTLFRHCRKALLTELSAKITGMAEHVTLNLLSSDPIRGEEGFRWLIHELLRTALYEALLPKFRFKQLYAELEAAKESWNMISGANARFLRFKDAVVNVLSNLPSQEELTKGKYIESGLQLALSEHISSPARVAMRYDRRYRERLESIVKRVSA
jgi:hypothetical protein